MTQNLSNEIQEDVYQVQQLFWAALQHKDGQAFERILADDFIARSPGQPNQNRMEFINTLTGFPAQVRSVGSDNLEVHVLETVAVVTGVQVAQIELTNGQLKENRIAITNIFQQRAGRWILRLAHAVPID